MCILTRSTLVGERRWETTGVRTCLFTVVELVDEGPFVLAVTICSFVMRLPRRQSPKPVPKQIGRRVTLYSVSQSLMSNMERGLKRCRLSTTHFH